MKILTTIGLFIVLIAVVIGLNLFMAWVFMLLWNWIVADVLGWIALSYWQAVGVTLLLGFLGGTVKAN